MNLRSLLPWQASPDVARLASEVRQLKSALSDAGGALRYIGGRGLPPKRDTRAILESYSQSPWVRAISKRVGDAVAGVEFCVYRQTSRSNAPEGAMARRFSRIGDHRKRGAVREMLVKQKKLEPVESHPVLEWLERGTGMLLDGHAVRSLSQIQVDLVGDSASIVETNGRGEPALWYPLSPHWLEEVPRPGQKYEFRIQVPGGARTTIPGENMLWLCDRDPREPYGLGTGIGRSLADEIDTDEFVSKFVKNTFFNDATPSLLVSVDGLRIDDVKAFEETWLQKLQGFLKGRRPLFLNKKVEVHQLQRTFEELQLSELRKFERDICMQVWGVPPEIFGIIENSNRSTIDASAYLFQLGIVLPRAEKWRSAINRQIMPKYNDPTLFVDFESPITEDKEHARAVYMQAPWAFTVDEHRALAGADALAGNSGQIFPSPLGLMPSDEPLSGDVPEPAGEPDPAADPAPDPADDGKSARLAVIRKRELSEAELNQILRALLPEDLRQGLASGVQGAVRELAERTLQDLGLSIRFNAASPRVVEFLRHEAATRVTRINRTTTQRLRVSLLEGTKAGDSFDDLAKRVDAVFETASTARARTIARTESVRAANFGALEGMQQGGVDKKEWLSSRDNRTRDAHAPGSGLDGITIPIGDEFVDPINGSRGQHPGDFPDPASSINCRCVLLSAFDDGKSAATTEAAKAAHWKRHELRRATFEGEIVRGVRQGFEKQRLRALKILEGLR